MASEQSDLTDFPHRTFVKAVGATAGAGLLGIGTTGAAVAGTSIDDRFPNWRAIEARTVRDRGCRGRPDRTAGLTDSDIEARHPHIGTWYGIAPEITWNGIAPEIIAGPVAIPEGDDDPGEVILESTAAGRTRSVLPPSARSGASSAR